MTYWSSMRRLFVSHHFDIVEETRHIKEGWRGHTRMIAAGGLAGTCFLGFLLLAHFVIRFLGGGTGSLRGYFFLELAFICFLALRFGKYWYLLFLTPMLWLYKPIAPIRLGSWLLWQAINLLSIFVMLVCSAQISERADEEHVSDRWWSSL